MALLKEDGSLDIEWVNNLQLKEHLRIIGELTTKQYKIYCSKLPINESYQLAHSIRVDKPMEEWGVDALEFINKMREKYENR